MAGGTTPVTVVKIGGSLMRQPAQLGEIVSVVTAATNPVLIVPGGGLIADGIRSAQAALPFSSALAHRFALDAMAKFADILVDLYPALQAVDGIHEAQRAMAGGRVPVWRAPAHFLGRPDIPETWSVTSDSIALLVSVEMAARQLVVIKQADLPSNDLAALSESGIVDIAFPTMAARFADRITVLGSGDFAQLPALLAGAR